MGTLMVSVVVWFEDAAAVLTQDRLLSLGRGGSSSVALVVSMASQLTPQLLRRSRGVEASLSACSAAGPRPGLRERLTRGSGQLMTWALEDSLERADAHARPRLGVGHAPHELPGRHPARIRCGEDLRRRGPRASLRVSRRRCVRAVELLPGDARARVLVGLCTLCRAYAAAGRCGRRRAHPLEGTGMTPPGKKPARGCAAIPALEVRDLTFTYPGGAAPVLDRASLVVPDGAFALLTGLTGSGKSTLLRLAKPEIGAGGRARGRGSRLRRRRPVLLAGGALPLRWATCSKAPTTRSCATPSGTRWPSASRTSASPLTRCAAAWPRPAISLAWARGSARRPPSFPVASGRRSPSRRRSPCARGCFCLTSRRACSTP